VVYKSLLDEAKGLAGHVGTILSAFDISELPQRERDLVVQLKNQLIDVRLDVQAYEYAQTRAEQQAAARDAKERLQVVQETILAASQHNIFGAVDVAQLSAVTEHIISRLE
jgi:CRISPR/Cas system-associated endonuclease Cas1